MELEFLPAVLASRPLVFKQRLKLAQQLHQHWHLDITDRTLVTTASVKRVSIRKLRNLSGAEVHLMTRRPEDWLDTMKAVKIKTVIVPVELGEFLRFILPMFRAQRIATCLAINPATALAALAPWDKYVQRVHVMAVRPGSGSARFQPAMIQRVRTLHRQFPHKTISVDGGMDEDTIPAMVAAGARIIIIGSRLMLNDRPQLEWQLLELLRRQMLSVI